MVFSKLFVDCITFTLFRNIIYLSISSSLLALFPSGEHNASVIQKALTEIFFEQSKHFLDIQVESDILAVQYNKKSIDLFFFFDFVKYFTKFNVFMFLGVSQTRGIYEINLKSL
jgi:hypothetical protein